MQSPESPRELQVSSVWVGFSQSVRPRLSSIGKGDLWRLILCLRLPDVEIMGVPHIQVWVLVSRETGVQDRAQAKRQVCLLTKRTVDKC